jgi:hypothetical protein
MKYKHGAGNHFLPFSPVDVRTREKTMDKKAPKSAGDRHAMGCVGRQKNQILILLNRPRKSVTNFCTGDLQSITLMKIQLRHVLNIDIWKWQINSENWRMMGGINKMDN